MRSGASDERSPDRAEPPVRGQTEVIGVVLLLGITVIGATAVVAFGSAALGDARETADNGAVGHAMTQLDSQAAIVALGDANVQSIRLGSGGRGSFRVDSDAGWMNVSHVNESAGEVETFLNGSLGSLVYESDDVAIAYQGGGVWRKQGDGSVMVSPPEFHYRDATLTLPLIQVNGTDSAAGSVRASLTNEMSARPVFPNSSESSYWSSNQRYANPVIDGNVTVTVHSEYYEAWAEFFRTRSDGQVDVYGGNETVQLTLETSDILGDFAIPWGDETQSVRGMGEEHPINNFTVTLESDQLNNRYWSLYTEKGSKEFELLVHSPPGAKCKGGDYDSNLRMSAYYYNGSTDYYQGWQNTTVDPDSDDDVDVICGGGTDSIQIDFTGDTPFEYGEIDLDVDKAGMTDHSGYDVAPNGTFDQHDVDDDGGRDGKYEADEEEYEPISFIVNHYLSLLGPSFDLQFDEGPGGSEFIDYEESGGTMDYNQSEGSVITFLHVTENRISIEIE